MNKLSLFLLVILSISLSSGALEIFGADSNSNNYINIVNLSVNGSSGGSSSGDAVQTINYTTNLGGGFTATAVDMKNRTYLGFAGYRSSITSSYDNSAINMSQGGYMTGLRVHRNSNQVGTNLTVSVNNGQINMTCRLDVGTNVNCQNNSVVYIPNDFRIAMEVRADNTTVLTGFLYTLEIVRNITINVSSSSSNASCNDCITSTIGNDTYVRKTGDTMTGELNVSISGNKIGFGDFFGLGVTQNCYVGYCGLSENLFNYFAYNPATDTFSITSLNGYDAFTNIRQGDYNLSSNLVNVTEVEIHPQRISGGIKITSNKFNSTAINFWNETSEIIVFGFSANGGAFYNGANKGDVVFRNKWGDFRWAINETDQLLFSEGRKNINVTNNISAKNVKAFVNTVTPLLNGFSTEGCSGSESLRTWNINGTPICRSLDLNDVLNQTNSYDEFALDTVYTNNLNRTIIVMGSLLSTVSNTVGSDTAYVAFEINSNRRLKFGIEGYTTVGKEDGHFAFSQSIPAGETFEFVSVLAGNGAVTLEYTTWI